MSLINASLLFGMGLAALPVILHMIMRSKPKRIEFPALRLLKSRKVSNSRRMQLRHLLLLLGQELGQSLHLLAHLQVADRLGIDDRHDIVRRALGVCRRGGHCWRR